MTIDLKFIQGNEACVEGALYAGVNFFADYPITPCAEIGEHMALKLPARGGKVIQMEDEIAAMCAILGASLTGHKVMTATSGPGFSLKQEAIGYACMAEIPCVIVNIQRSGPSTGNPTGVSQGDVNQVRWGTHGDHAIICLSASNLQDIFEMTITAFNLAETYRTPVVLLFDEMVGHIREKVLIPEKGDIPIISRLKTKVPRDIDYHPYLAREDGRLPMSDFGSEHRYNITGLFHDMWGFPSNNPKEIEDLLHHLTHKIENNAYLISRHKEYFLEDAQYILVSYGSSTRSAIQLALDKQSKGEKIGVLELQTLWPFPEAIVREKCCDAKAVLVVEMNMGQMFINVKAALEVSEKVVLANRIDGQIITPENINMVLRAVQGKGL